MEIRQRIQGASALTGSVALRAAGTCLSENTSAHGPGLGRGVCSATRHALVAVTSGGQQKVRSLQVAASFSGTESVGHTFVLRKCGFSDLILRSSCCSRHAGVWHGGSCAPWADSHRPTDRPARLDCITGKAIDSALWPNVTRQLSVDGSVSRSPFCKHEFEVICKE